MTAFPLYAFVVAALTAGVQAMPNHNSNKPVTSTFEGNATTSTAFFNTTDVSVAPTSTIFANATGTAIPPAFPTQVGGFICYPVGSGFEVPFIPGYNNGTNGTIPDNSTTFVFPTSTEFFNFTSSAFTSTVSHHRSATTTAPAFNSSAAITTTAPVFNSSAAIATTAPAFNSSIVEASSTAVFISSFEANTTGFATTFFSSGTITAPVVTATAVPNNFVCYPVSAGVPIYNFNPDNSTQFSTFISSAPTTTPTAFISSAPTTTPTAFISSAPTTTPTAFTNTFSGALTTTPTAAPVPVTSATTSTF